MWHFSQKTQHNTWWNISKTIITIVYLCDYTELFHNLFFKRTQSPRTYLISCMYLSGATTACSVGRYTLANMCIICSFFWFIVYSFIVLYFLQFLLRQYWAFVSNHWSVDLTQCQCHSFPNNRGVSCDRLLCISCRSKGRYQPPVCHIISHLMLWRAC